MKTLLFLVLLFIYSSTIAADSIRKVDLKYRDAVATQALLEDLFKEEISIVVDSNSLLIRGAAADLQAIATMVKRLDKPRSLLRVSLYRGVDPYRGDVDESTRRISSTHTHNDNVLDQWLMEDGTTLVIRDNVRVIDHQEQLLVGIGRNNGKTLLATQKAEQNVEKKQHDIRLTLTDNQQSVRLAIKTQLANRAATGNDGEIISTDVQSTRVITANQWVRLFYRQNQSQRLTPTNKKIATTALNFDDEQALWVLVEPLDI